MKKLLLTLLLISTNVFAVNPVKEPLTNINCTLPTARGGGAVFDYAVEGKEVHWYYGFASKSYPSTVITPFCQWTIDNKMFAGKTLYIVATVIDKDTRESVYSSPEYVHVVDKIVLPPKPPTGMTATPAATGQVATPLP